MATVAVKVHQQLVLLEQQIRSKDLIRMKRSDHLRLLTVAVTEVGDEIFLTVLVTRALAWIRFLPHKLTRDRENNPLGSRP